jgi:putative two-component system response regulator
MKNGIIFSIILLIIVIIEAFIPGASRFNYHLDISIRMVAAYVLVLTITLVLETSRKNKDKLNERLMLELKGSIDDLACANNEIENQKNELRNYNENLEKMVQEKIKTIVVLKNAVMETIADLVERRDKTTGGHISRTSNYMRIFIDEIIKEKLYQEQTALWNKEEIVLSAQLHDVGKIGIDDIILLKPAKLSAVEFEVMKNHTLMGGEIIKEIQQKTGESEFLDFAFIFAVYHHEKWNGTGYPYRISRKKIPLPARIMSIIDVYDALISLRPYKEPLSHEEAIKIINEEKSTSFDPALTELFISISSRFKEVG